MSRFSHITTAESFLHGTLITNKSSDRRAINCVTSKIYYDIILYLSGTPFPNNSSHWDIQNNYPSANQHVGFCVCFCKTRIPVVRDCQC